MALFFDSSTHGSAGHAKRTVFLPLLVSMLLVGCAERFPQNEIASLKSVAVASVNVVTHGERLSNMPPQIAKTIETTFAAELVKKGYVIKADPVQADFIVVASFGGEAPPPNPARSATAFAPVETSTFNVFFRKHGGRTLHSLSIDTNTPLGAVTVRQAEDLARAALADLPAKANPAL
ncbi:MAG: hypothetical protein LBS59_03065 [Puniceicoccales bacterium]|nr:hypothetical protein [Puniceicoccales bacterium]